MDASDTKTMKSVKGYVGRGTTAGGGFVVTAAFIEHVMITTTAVKGK